MKFKYRIVNDTYEYLDPIAIIETDSSGSNLIYTLNGKPVIVKKIPKFYPSPTKNKIQPPYSFLLGNKFYISPITTFYIECITNNNCSSASLKPIPIDTPSKSHEYYMQYITFRKGEAEIISEMFKQSYFPIDREQMKMLYHIIKGEFISLAPYFEYCSDYSYRKVNINIYTGIVNYKSGNIYTIYITDNNLIVFGLTGFVKVKMKSISLKSIDNITATSFHSNIKDLPAVLAISSLVSSIDIEGYKNIMPLEIVKDGKIFTPYIRLYLLISSDNKLETETEKYKNWLKKKINLNFGNITGIPVIDIDMQNFKIVWYDQ